MRGYGQAMTAELRRNLVLALVGLAGGFALIVALFGSAELLKRPFAPAGQETAKPSTELDRPGGSRADTALGSAAKQENAGSASAGKPGDTTSTESKPDASKPEAVDAKAPSFDLVRVEPTGETVVAGRGLPNTAVEMLVNGKPVARALADPNGQFALVPPALGPGNSEIVLRLTDERGRETRSPQSVAVVVSPDRKTRPLVALSSPDSPTVVLSQPEVATGAPTVPGASSEARAAQTAGKAPAGADKAASAQAAKDAGGKTPAAGADAAAKKAPPLKIVSVDAQEGGRLYVTGQAAPGATVRLYLNDTLVAPASVGPDGKVVFTIGKGVAAGDYRVRVDQVDPVTGAVRTRAEVPFVFPESAARTAAREPAGEGVRAGAGKAVAAVPPPGVRPEHAAPSPGASGQAAAPAAPGKPAPKAADALAVASGAAETPAANAGGAFVAEIATARITRGDNLWQISRRVYGSGLRYTVIYDANQEQIRDPDRIFPGQIFVLPKDGKGGRG